MKTIISSLSFALLAAGCVGGPSDTTEAIHAPGAARPTMAVPVGGAQPSADLAEYRHRIESSKFQVGARARTESDGDTVKVAGDEGVFATDLRNGAVRAAPNGDAPSSRRPALTRDGDEHNSRVVDYFTGAGLPADQVRAAHVTTIMKAGGTAFDPMVPEFVAYTSILERAVDGISIPDSFAWARFNRDDVVMAESAYWPRIPGAVIDDARALRALVEDPIAGPRFRAHLGIGDAPGQVVIRHADSASHTGWFAFASYDVQEPAPTQMNHRGRTRHFTSDGAERDLR